MMSTAEVQDWQRNHTRGLRRYLLHETLTGTLPFFVIGVVVIWLFRDQDLRFPVLMAVAGVLISLAVTVLFSLALWFFQERRYRKRVEAEARGELPRSVGV